MEASEQRSAETAARHLVRRVPRARARDRAGAVLAGLVGGDYDAVDAIYVVDEDGRLQGLVRLRDLFALPAERPLGEAMDARPPHVRPDEDQERVAVLAIRHRVAAVPVVDEGGRLLGVVPAQALIEILRREHIEDLHRLAGIRRENDQARNAMEAPPARRARDRLPWLLVGLVGSMIATWVMSRFERVLEAYVAVAFFVPGIVYLADAIGTQTEAIAVRGLSLSHAPLRRLLGSELRTGLLIGLGLGALIFPSVLLAFGDLRLAVSVALGVLVAGAAATTIGLLLPWLLSRAGKDPAFGSGPMATIIQDVLSLLVYFTIVSLLLI
ncbi:MAG: magnesium transporter [Pseudomonadota bacterium]